MVKASSSVPASVGDIFNELLVQNLLSSMYTTSMHCAALTVLALIVTVNCHGSMRIEIRRYTNNHGRCSDGTFCDPLGIIDVKQTPCDPYFRLVADRLAAGGNGLFDYQTGVYWDVDQVTFGNKFGDRDNPVTIPMNYNDNPGSLQMQMRVMDKDTINADDHMDTFSASLVATADGVIRNLEMISPPMLSQLHVKYLYTCHTDYYGLDCNKFCKAHDDNVNGHYTCDASGNMVCMTGWIGSDCTVPHPCASNPCLHGGTCTNVDGAAKCSCPSGITGSRCEIDVNECAESSPCVNDGTCVNSFGGFSCTCPTGFTGRLCEQDINECAVTEPCLNGGTCVNSFGNFSCQCPPGLTGKHCEEDINECAEAEECMNGGTCVNNFGNFSCECPMGLTGRYCEQDVNECMEAEQCVNGGTCVNGFGNFSCECPPGLTGERCEEDVDECAESNPCKNGGTCTNSFGSFSCQCPRGFSGWRCELVGHVDGCAESVPCKNGGACTNVSGNFTCRCKAEFTGKLCETDINECNQSPSPCLNGGTCVNRFGGFACQCPVEFKGHLCENPVCNSTTCANNGSCEVGSDGSVTCHCQFGYSGDRCEDTVDLNDCRLHAKCQNGGSCILMKTGQYRCRCSYGYLGTVCDVNVFDSVAPRLQSWFPLSYAVVLFIHLTTSVLLS